MKSKLEERGPMTLMVECEDCKSKFPVNRENGTATFKKKFMYDGQSIFLTYYDCPKCGRRHYAQIDNGESLKELHSVQQQFVKLALLERKGKKIPKNQSARFNEARQHLSDYRMELMKQFAGKTIYDEESGTNFELRFSV